MRKFLAVSFLALVLMVPAGSAWAKDFSLPTARVDVRIDEHGAVLVTERITYLFNGSFSGGYREIPLRAGERIDRVSVSEDGTEYQPGAPTELGSSGPVGSFGSTTIPGGAYRIVWHYSAFDERRTFTVRYRIRGLTDAYDDVADVNLHVWGDEWTTDLRRLEATMDLPGAAPDEVRVWGH